MANPEQQNGGTGHHDSEGQPHRQSPAGMTLVRPFADWDASPEAARSTF
jgi:hypothetical protein